MSKRLLAMGGGGFLAGTHPELDQLALSLTHKPRPTILFIPTASGDDNVHIDRFYARFESETRPRHLLVFRQQRGGLARHFQDVDLIYVGGGNTANLLALWRLHQVDALVDDATNKGVPLAGVSAGACCLFEACITDSFGTQMTPMSDGLGWLPGSFCPHAQESRRFARFQQSTHPDASLIPSGIGLADGAAALYEDGARTVFALKGPQEAAWAVSQGKAHPIQANAL